MKRKEHNAYCDKHAKILCESCYHSDTCKRLSLPCSDYTPTMSSCLNEPMEPAYINLKYERVR